MTFISTLACAHNQTFTSARLNLIAEQRSLKEEPPSDTKKKNPTTTGIPVLTSHIWCCHWASWEHRWIKPCTKNNGPHHSTLKGHFTKTLAFFFFFLLYLSTFCNEITFLSLPPHAMELNGIPFEEKNNSILVSLCIIYKTGYILKQLP